MLVLCNVRLDKGQYDITDATFRRQLFYAQLAIIQLGLRSRLLVCDHSCYHIIFHVIFITQKQTILYTKCSISLFTGHSWYKNFYSITWSCGSSLLWSPDRVNITQVWLQTKGGRYLPSLLLVWAQINAYSAGERTNDVRQRIRVLKCSTDWVGAGTPSGA